MILRGSDLQLDRDLWTAFAILESEFSDHGYYVSVEAHMFALDYVTSGYVDADIEMS